MTTHKIITIGRQFGSGGHEIGNLLATRLDIPLYDNNLVRMAAEKMDIREETAKAIDETSLNSFVSSYLITPMGYSSYINSEEYVQPLSEQMYELQTEIIKKLAEPGPCVFVGERKYYYETHTGQEWGSISSHEILLNASLLGIEGTVDILEGIYKR